LQGSRADYTDANGGAFAGELFTGLHETTAASKGVFSRICWRCSGQTVRMLIMKKPPGSSRRAQKKLEGAINAFNLAGGLAALFGFPSYCCDCLKFLLSGIKATKKSGKLQMSTGSHPMFQDV